MSRFFDDDYEPDYREELDFDGPDGHPEEEDSFYEDGDSSPDEFFDNEPEGYPPDYGYDDYPEFDG